MLLLLGNKRCLSRFRCAVSSLGLVWPIRELSGWRFQQTLYEGFHRVGCLNGASAPCTPNSTTDSSIQIDKKSTITSVVCSTPEDVPPTTTTEEVKSVSECLKKPSNSSRLPMVNLKLMTGAPKMMRLSKFYNQKEQKILSKWIRERLQLGHIEEVSSKKVSWTAPATIVIKKNGNPRVTHNFSRLNSWLESGPSHHERCDRMIRWSASLKYVNKIDLSKAFHSMKVPEHQRHLLGFTFQNRFFRYSTLPMGLRDSPAYFAEFVSNMLSEMTAEDKRMIRSFQDDFIIGGSDPSDLESRTKRLKKILIKNGCIINNEKIFLDFDTSQENFWKSMPIASESTPECSSTSL